MFILCLLCICIPHECRSSLMPKEIIWYPSAGVTGSVNVSWEPNSRVCTKTTGVPKHWAITQASRYLLQLHIYGIKVHVQVHLESEHSMWVFVFFHSLSLGIELRLSTGQQALLLWTSHCFHRYIDITE